MPAAAGFYEADCLVDTGAVHCLAPGDRLRTAGIKPEGRAVYELANGEAVEYEYGFARIEFLGSVTLAKVIFGPANVEPILGVVALEDAGITVDSIKANVQTAARNSSEVQREGRSKPKPSAPTRLDW